LKIIDEDWLLDIFISGGPSFSRLLCHLRFDLLSREGLKNLFEYIHYDDVTEMIWNSLVRCLTIPGDIGERFGGLIRQ
jgi:hypothetical protein